ncbi:MAG TPA: DUF1326 domain-containing protein [Vicinamibacterales bacterium]|nr:DUF1326 domain-containing protein [Vicinamibacterales bacterium]
MRTLFIAAVIALGFTTPPRAAETWHITATVAESCSCTVSCPCNFGGEPNRNPCEGNRLIAIKSGHYGDVDLANVSFLVTFQMRSWSKIYLSDTVTDRQKDAVEALLPIAFAGFHRGMLSFTKAPITMNITDKRVTFSGPESSVEMEAMKGFDGKNVTIMNLPNAAYQDYTQFKSISHTHASADHSWKHAATNGFTSTMDVGSK